jgi:CMP-N-acetylneuraminic acid synthetase
MQVTCFLPCRAGSERIPHKNTRQIAHHHDGLVGIKLQQLQASDRIEKVVLSTDDELKIELAQYYPKVEIHRRRPDLCRNDTSTDALIAHAVELIPSGHILWTHVTSPFLSDYDSLIRDYFKLLALGLDSLMTTTVMHGFLWRHGRPLNYARDLERWPRTQTITPVHEINSGAFIASADIYRQGDRIGKNPYLCSLTPTQSIDIDMPGDFDLAERLLRAP